MSTQSRIYVAIAAVWAASLFAVGASAQAPAQVREYRALPEPRVLTGPEVGFRVDGMYGEVPTGVVVLRVKGQWVEARVGGHPQLRR